MGRQDEKIDLVRKIYQNLGFDFDDANQKPISNLFLLTKQSLSELNQALESKFSRKKLTSSSARGDCRNCGSVLRSSSQMLTGYCEDCMRSYEAGIKKQQQVEEVMIDEPKDKVNSAQEFLINNGLNDLVLNDTLKKEKWVYASDVMIKFVKSKLKAKYSNEKS